MSKDSSGPKHTKTGQKDSGIKFIGQTNQSSKHFGQIGESMCGDELVKEQYHTSRKT